MHSTTEIDADQINLVPGLCMSMGIIKSVNAGNEKNRLIHMPYAFYPYWLLKKTYQKIMKMHELWGKLLAKLSYDHQFLLDFSQKISQGDQFISKLTEIYHRHPGFNKPKVVCLRADYMGDDDPSLVELNLVSVGLNGISDRIQALSKIIGSHSKYDCQYPENRNQQAFCEAFVKGMDICGYKGGYIIMVVHQPEFNFGDQNAFKLEMLKHNRIVISATMLQLIDGLTIQENTNVPRYNGKKIDGFYYRTGYDPSHFIDERHWKLKEDIQRSESIKVPSIDMMILNTKTMQARLGQKQFLNKYVTEQQAIEIAGVNEEIYDLGELNAQQLSELEQKMSKRAYILKPNREGGGHNFFGKQAYEKYLELKEKDLLQIYILQKVIECRKQPNVFIANFTNTPIQKATCEYSTMGGLVYHNGEVLFNHCGGSLVRLKKAQMNQGGIARDLGAIAGLYLIDSE